MCDYLILSPHIHYFPVPVMPSHDMSPDKKLLLSLFQLSSFSVITHISFYNPYFRFYHSNVIMVVPFFCGPPHNYSWYPYFSWLSISVIFHLFFWFHGTRLPTKQYLCPTEKSSVVQVSVEVKVIVLYTQKCVQSVQSELHYCSCRH